MKRKVNLYSYIPLKSTHIYFITSVRCSCTKSSQSKGEDGNKVRTDEDWSTPTNYHRDERFQLWTKGRVEIYIMENLRLNYTNQNLLKDYHTLPFKFTQKSCRWDYKYSLFSFEFLYYFNYYLNIRFVTTYTPKFQNDIDVSHVTLNSRHYKL